VRRSLTRERPDSRVSAEARQSALAHALLKRAGAWQEAEARARRFSRGRSDDPVEAARVADDYRLLAHDLARARALLPRSRARAYLESVYARVHATLNHGDWRLWATLQRLFRDEIPASVRWLRPYLMWATLLFVLAGCAGYALVARYPELIALFASPDLIASVESGKLWTEGLLNIVPSSVLSVQILANNIVVSLLAYCTGFLFGLGTLYIVGLNGLMLGAVFAFVARNGLAGALATFIVAHGCVELSVMCLSGAAGAAVGEALARPGSHGRIAAFRAAALRSGPALIACTVLLVGAGLIEGFVSPQPRIPVAVKVAVGVGYWLLMLALLTGSLWRLPGYTRRARRSDS
jgi:uncharacterized membrane protein SpoIIM required for sporulation